MGRTNKPSTIIIADANVLFRRGLRTLFAAQERLEVVDEAFDVDEALEKVRCLTPDILIMDLKMIKTDAKDSTIAVRQTQPSTSLLCITDQDGETELDTAIGAGAQGYMRRDTPAERMIAATKLLAENKGELNPHGLSRIVPDLQALAKNSNRYARVTPLTVREQEVVRLLAEGKTVRQVAAELSLSMKTVEAHKLNLMRKLDIHNRASLVEYAIHTGLAVA